MVAVGEGWELRHEEQLLATLGNPAFAAEVECVTRDGRWVFARLRGGHTEAKTGAAVVARYKSNALPGGIITLPDETKLRLRPPATSQTWRVRRGVREAILELRLREVHWEIEFSPGARDIYHLPLLTMFAFHAVLVELDAPGGSTGGNGGGF
jgi:hypothetical protein